MDMYKEKRYCSEGRAIIIPTLKGQGKEKLTKKNEKGRLKTLNVGLNGPWKCFCQDGMSHQQ